MTSTGFMIEDKKQNVWIAKGEEGVYRLDSNNQLTLYLSKDNGYVKSICEDSREYLCRKYEKGLFVYNKDKTLLYLLILKKRENFLSVSSIPDRKMNYISELTVKV